jgi:hypothetical protein
MFGNVLIVLSYGLVSWITLLASEDLIPFLSFQTGRSHILLVTANPGEDKGAMGIVTLEDVVEVSLIHIYPILLSIPQELIGKEIIVSKRPMIMIYPNNA